MTTAEKIENIFQYIEANTDQKTSAIIKREYVKYNPTADGSYYTVTEKFTILNVLCALKAELEKEAERAASKKGNGKRLAALKQILKSAVSMRGAEAHWMEDGKELFTDSFRMYELNKPTGLTVPERDPDKRCLSACSFFPTKDKLHEVFFPEKEIRIEYEQEKARLTAAGNKPSLAKQSAIYFDNNRAISAEQLFTALDIFPDARFYAPEKATGTILVESEDGRAVVCPIRRPVEESQRNCFIDLDNLDETSA